MFAIDLIYNLGLLIALSGIISAFFDQRKGLRRCERVLQGVLFGTMALIVLLTLPDARPGAILDGRSIILGTCGLFFGSMAALIAGGMALAGCFFQESTALYSGVLSIVFPACTGLLFHELWIRKHRPLHIVHLWLFGLLTHAVMLLLPFTLPDGQAVPALRAVSAPYLVAFPLATVLIGKILYGLKERAHFLDALIQSKEEIRTALYSIGDAVISTDDQGRVRQMNPAAEELTGWPEAVARGQPLSRIFHVVSETARETLPDPAQRVLLSGQPQKLNPRALLIARDGSARPIADSAAPIRDAAGRITGVILVFRDQTRERAARESRERQMRHLSELLHHLPIGVLMFEVPSGRMLIANRAARDILGDALAEDITARQMVERYPAGIMPERIPFPPGERPILQCMDGKQTHVEDMLLTRPDGTERHLELFGSPIFNEQGEQQAGLISFLDITPRKQAEAEHRDLKEQFRQSQKIEAVGRLAGGIAHDFNNMLQVILGRAELLSRSDQLTPAQSEGIKEISKAAGRSAELTRQLLAFARKQPIAPAILDLNEAVHGTLSMLKRLIGEHIELHWEPSAAPETVRIDPSQVTQILTNLAVNARDAISRSGRITIESGRAMFDDDYCRTHAGFLPGEYVMLAVSDNGCGMDKETIAQIFEPFFTTKPAGQHSGLGLSTLYGIVRQNGGFVNVYSEPGEGTTFRIYLPRCAAAGPAAGAPPPAPPPKGRETILLVEDEQALLTLAKDQLEELGYTVLAFSDPETALRAAAEHPAEIHLLLTDAVMPKLSGLDLAKKTAVLRPDIETLFMSGYPANVIVHHGILDENIHFIQKPFSQQTLAEKIRSVLAG